MQHAELRALLINCFDDTGWHLSLWFPRVTREVVGLSPGVPDSDIQKCLLDLICEGVLETGTVEGSDFVTTAASLPPSGPCPDLYVRAAAGVAHSR